jgi:hypothetical protein
MPHELADRDHRQVVRPGEPSQLRAAGHVRAVGVDHLGEDAGGPPARQAGEVDRGLRVAGTGQDAAGAAAQREHVAGPHEVGRPAPEVGQGVDGGRAIGGRDPGGHAGGEVDRDREGGAVGLGVVMHHQREVERVEPVALERDADHAGGVPQEERDLLARGRVRGHDEVALVLAVLCVGDDRYVTAAYGGNGCRGG